jgi:hypothetical protein
LKVKPFFRSQLQSFCLILGLLCALDVAAQAAPYRYATPAGWTKTSEGGVDTLTPNAEPAGAAQILLLTPSPLGQNFDAQFDTERATLETHWGLAKPLATPAQRGKTAEGPYAAHFSSYIAEGVPRYMSFLAVGRQGKFAMVVFVASSDDAFNRLAPLATQLWQSLQVVP